MSATRAPPGEKSARPGLAGSAGDPAIDLAHLARQTDDDGALADELLGLFDRQLASLIAQASAGDAPRRRRAEAAHQLRGSALAVGAGAVARAAQALEASLARPDAESGEIDTALAALGGAIGEARTAIAKLRR
jgi:HPt (histidine-containing phosphotransfer) domain-containing protein